MYEFQDEFKKFLYYEKFEFRCKLLTEFMSQF